MLSDQFLGTPDHDDVLRLVAFVAVLILVSALTQRYIEAPFQRLGRRISRRPATAVRQAVPPVPVHAPAPDGVPS